MLSGSLSNVSAPHWRTVAGHPKELGWSGQLVVMVNRQACPHYLPWARAALPNHQVSWLAQTQVQQAAPTPPVQVN